MVKWFPVDCSLVCVTESVDVAFEVTIDVCPSSVVTIFVANNVVSVTLENGNGSFILVLGNVEWLRTVWLVEYLLDISLDEVLETKVEELMLVLPSLLMSECVSVVATPVLCSMCCVVCSSTAQG